MELEAEDGAIIFVPKGCKKELGRGPGIATRDLTVSRRQILLEVKGPNPNDGSLDNLSGKLHVQVLGPNPVCIVHGRQRNPKSTGRQHCPEGMMLLRKGEVGYLSAGDKLSLSVRLPFFFNVKEGDQRMRDAMPGYIKKPGSTLGESGKEEIVSNVVVLSQAAEDDLLGSWKARKSGKGIKQLDSEHIQTTKDEGTSHLADDKEVFGKEEEIGIAEAVARRQKRAYERSQKHQQNLQVELDKDSRGVAETSDFVNDGQELAHCLVDTKGIDPVKEFGFLVEGCEFEQYGKRRRHDGNKWDYSFSKDHIDEDEEQEGKTSTKGHHSTSSRRKKTKKDEDDDEWMGENEEEKLASSSVKKSKLITKPCLRSDRPSSSPSKKTSAGARRKYSSNNNMEQSEEDEDDETLGGFIVDDDEEEEDSLDEEEELSDDDEDADDSPVAKVQHQQQRTQKADDKPLCKYGKNCYRKNKQHLEEYRH